MGRDNGRLPSDAVLMIDPQRYPRLSRISVPAELRAFPEEELPAIADELRAYLIEQVAQSGVATKSAAASGPVTCATSGLSADGPW